MIGWFAAPFVMALLVLTVGNAAAQDAAKLTSFKATDYPIEIRKALSYGPGECKRQGGGKVMFAPDTVRKVDLNSDGRDDYIISFADTECTGRLAVYCGTGLQPRHLCDACQRKAAQRVLGSRPRLRDPAG